MSASRPQAVTDSRADTSRLEASPCTCRPEAKQHWPVERSLAEAIPFAQSCIDSLREPIIILDRSLRVRTANRSFYHNFRASAAEIESVFIYDLWNKQLDCPPLRTLLGEVLPKDPSVPDELEIVLDIPSLGRRVILLNARRLWYQGRNSEVTLMALEDITNRKRAEAEMQNKLTELKRQVNELKRSNEDLEQFALVAAHDLQSPLRTALQFAQLWERKYKDKLDNDADDPLSVITGNLNRMWALVGALLRYAQVTTVEEPASLSTSSEAVMKLALVDLETIITETDAVITHDDLPTVSVDPTQLLQLFQNLIANGIRYRSIERPRLHMSAARQSDIWLFSLRDNGIGIEPRYFDQIFQPFKRLHGQERPGSGVGLAICKKIVQRYRGDIWVTSELGTGSTFHFTLPA